MSKGTSNSARSKMCRFYPAKRCYHLSCSLIDEFGNVGVCPCHPHPEGLFSVRKRGFVLVSIFSKGFQRDRSVF